jgi:hypothetical protein
MAATKMNNGLDPLNINILGGAAAGQWTLHLFTNVITPGVTNTVGSYTECALTGYAAVALTPGSWTGSTTGGVATYTYPAVTFTFSTGSVTIFGYYITFQISATVYLLCAQNFASSYAVPSGGGGMVVNLTETFQ